MAAVRSQKSLCLNLWYSTDKWTGKDNRVCWWCFYSEHWRWVLTGEKLQKDHAKQRAWARWWQGKFTGGGTKWRRQKSHPWGDECWGDHCRSMTKMLGIARAVKYKRCFSENVNLSFGNYFSVSSGYKSKYYNGKGIKNVLKMSHCYSVSVFLAS